MAAERDLRSLHEMGVLPRRGAGFAAISEATGLLYSGTQTELMGSQAANKTVMQ